MKPWFSVVSVFGRQKPLLVASLLAAAAGCSNHARLSVLPPEEARQLLLDRNWIDRLPETTQDRLHVFRFVPQMGGGVYQDRTLYAGQFELFTFSQDGQTLVFHLHHTGEEKAGSLYHRRASRR